MMLVCSCSLPPSACKSCPNNLAHFGLEYISEQDYDYPPLKYLNNERSVEFKIVLEELREAIKKINNTEQTIIEEKEE